MSRIAHSARRFLFALISVFLWHACLPLFLTLAPSSNAYALPPVPAGCEYPPQDEPDGDGDECYVPPDPAKSQGDSCSQSTNASPSQAGQTCGDPINATTGNTYERERDYAGAGVFPLTLTRAYNSQSTDAGRFGANWSDSFSAHLVRISATVVQAVRPDHKTLTFTLVNGQWTADADVNDRLSAMASGWRYVTGQDAVETYDAQGRLLRLTNRAGLSQTLAYDAQGNLLSVTDPVGRTLRFDNDAQGRVVALTDPAGRAYAYTYDANDNLTSVTYPDGSVRAYLYEDAAFPHALTGLIDENGARFATWTYDGSGRAVSSTHAGGIDKTSVGYDFSNGATTVTDARGHALLYSYLTAYGVAHTLHATKPAVGGGNVTNSWFYDANGNISSYIDYRNLRTDYTYDPARNLELSRTEAAGTPEARTTTTTWSANFRLPVAIAEPNRVTRFAYDGYGNLLTRTVTANGQSRTWRFAYNAFGEVTAVDGPRTDVSDVTRFDYDGQGNLIQVTDALGHVTRLGNYDADGRAHTIADPNGRVTTLSYDARGRLVARQVGTELTTYSYDRAGNLVALTRPDQSRVTFQHDAAHRLIGVADRLGNRLVLTRDRTSNVVKIEAFDASGSRVTTQSRAFDALNRLASRVGSAGQTTTYAYDDDDNLVAVTDPLGHRITRAYDALNRLSALTSARGGVAQFAYDANDNLVAVTDPLGHATNYGYDGLGDLRAVQSPDRGDTVQVVDDAGNVISRTDARGQTVNEQYDALNRVTGITYAGGSVTFTYDEGRNGIGHLTGMTDPSGSTRFHYDRQGHLTRKTERVGRLRLTTRYAYDEAGRLLTITYPLGPHRAPALRRRRARAPPRRRRPPASSRR